MNGRTRIEEFVKSNQSFYDYVNGNEELDVLEMLARQKINIMYSDIFLETENPKLKELFDNIKKNNNLKKFLKGMERYLSKDGKAFFVWDIFEEGEYGYNERTVKLMMAVPNNPKNQTLRAFQQKEYAGTCLLQTTTTRNGLRQLVYQCRTPNETQNLPWDTAVPQNGLPLDNFMISTPAFLNPYMVKHTRVHNYGHPSLREIYNKNAIDFNDQNDYLQPDAYPVMYLRETINSYLVWIKEEQKKNGTKWVGTFESGAEMWQRNHGEASFNYNGVNSQLAQSIYEEQNKKRSILEDSYVMMLATGGLHSNVDKIQSTFDMEKNTRGLGSLLEIFFNGAGFDWSIQSLSGSSQYASTTEIQSDNRRTCETIKEAILLRQEQHTEIFNNIIDAWFGKIDAYKEFEGQWDYKIISNIVNEEAYSIEKLSLMLENGLISKKLAIQKANKDLTPSQLKELMEDIEKEQAEQEEKEMEMMEASKPPMNGNPNNKKQIGGKPKGKFKNG
ncbi:MAG: hypothetical protein ACRCUM_01730 [Mycoplasmoidaceae bacterium]